MRCTSLQASLLMMMKGELLRDFNRWLEKLAPYSPEEYFHNKTGEDNADAHIKRQVVGRETTVAITKGRLDFGP
jgi:thiamine phosphate synthase YjbQ (UPF0047 family)